MILFLSRLLNYLRFLVNHQKYGHVVDVEISKYDFVEVVPFRIDLGYDFKVVPSPEMGDVLRSFGAKIGHVECEGISLANEVHGTALQDPWVKFYFPTAESAIVFKLGYL